MKKYVIIAGVNGAGKSTLYSLFHSWSSIEKVNLDEIVRENGDWSSEWIIDYNLTIRRFL